MKWILTFLLALQPSPWPAWQPIGPWGGAARAIRLDPARPDTMLAISMRGTGAFRSRDAAKTWTLLTNFPELPNTRLDAAWILPGKWLIGAAPGGLYASTNEGDSWQVVPGTEKLSVYAITSWQRDPRVVAIGTNQGVWMSNDAAATWRRISPKTIDDLTAIVSVAFHPARAGTLYAGTPHLPWKTTNAGATWTKAHSGMYDDSDIFSIVLDSTQEGRMFASACSGIYCSTNGGVAWRRVQGIPGNNRRTYVVAQSPHHPRLLFAGTSAGMWKSEDTGNTWKKLNEMVATSIAFHPTSKQSFYISTERHGLLRTDDDGVTFTPRNEGFASRSIEALESEGANLKAISRYDGSFSRTQAANSWQPVAYAEPTPSPRSSDWYQTVTDPFNPALLLRASANGITKSIDGGATWRNVKNDWVKAIAFHPKRKGLCFALKQQRVFWSPDAGENWYWLPAQEDTFLVFEKLHISAAEPDKLYAVSPSRGVYMQSIANIR